MPNVGRSSLSALAVLALAMAPLACGGSAPTESDAVGVATAQATTCPLPQGDGVHPESCIVIPPVTPPKTPLPIAPSTAIFPSLANLTCPSGTTCSYTPTGLGSPPGLTCSESYWYNQADSTGTTTLYYMVAYCSTTGTSSVPTWIAANPTYTPSFTAIQPGLPTPAAGFTYLHYLPPIQDPNGFPDLSAYPADELTGMGYPFYGRLVFWWVPCTQLYESTQNASAFPRDSPQTPRIMSCVPSLNLLNWMAKYPDPCTTNICANAKVTDGSDFDLLEPPPFGYVYVEFSSMGGPIGGGCESGCGGPHY